MESLQSLKSRLRAVKNIGQITKAMEVVSATKMRKAQEAALNSRAYAFHAMHILYKLSRLENIRDFPLLFAREVRPAQKTLVVLVSSDRGLAGSFNTQIFKRTENFMKTDSGNGKNHDYFFITIGKKSSQFASKKKFNVLHKLFDYGDYIELEEAEPLVNLLVEGFKKGEWDRVVTISTHFRTTLKQEVLIRQILPIDFEKINETIKELVPEHGRWADLRKTIDQDNDHNNNHNYDNDYIFEPSPKEILNDLLPHLMKMQIYHLILEANASEHSARMVAMQNASDNAEELSGEITLDYNKARQAGITKEIIEIVGTQTAMT
ncbi:ATP synthase F1 subunit gamma [Candidatus Giovannonibacteria bacterium]|nr:ATP synthase F1 subunit gamma [Candidatus Giovannonibacteria bacterium]